MTITYQVTENELGGKNIIRIGEDGAMAAIPSDPANSDYAAYLAYVANGNQTPAVVIDIPPVEPSAEPSDTITPTQSDEIAPSEGTTNVS